MTDLLTRLRLWIEHVVRTLCRLLILGVSIAGLILLLFDGIGKFFTSSEFTVEEITIQGNRRVTQDEIRALTALAPGTNIWLFDLEELGKRLENHPSIRSATVRRIPPRRIHIDIQERETIAFFLREDGSLMGLDAGGVAIPPPPSFRQKTAAQPISEMDIQTLLSYPILRGHSSMPQIAGERVTDSGTREALLFLERLQSHCPDFFREIVEGDVKEDGNFVLHLRRRIGIVILRDLASLDLEKKINAFWRVMEEKNLRAVYVDGRFPEKGFAVRVGDPQIERWESLYKPHETI